MTKHSLLAAAFCAALAAPASAVLPGWDACKWNDPDHQTPKYVVGRIVAAFPHTPAGLRQAAPIINAVYPGTTILAGKGDKVLIPCVGTVDLITSAGTGGTGWWWGADEAGNECGKCKPNRCEDVSKSKKCGDATGGAGAGTGAGTGEAGSGFGGAAGNCAGVRVPNELAVVRQTAIDNPDAWSAKLDPDEMGKCRPDSRYLDLVVQNLRKKDLRWGYNCKRGNCNDVSHDVVAYYFGQGRAYEGAPQVMLVDMIQNTCAPNASPNWLVLEANFGNGSGAGWTSKGKFASGPRQDVRMNCPLKKEASATPAAQTFSSAGGGGGTTGGGGGGSSSPSSSSAAKPAAKKDDGGIGVRNDGAAGDAPTVSSTTVEGSEPVEEEP